MGNGQRINCPTFDQIHKLGLPDMVKTEIVKLLDLC